MTIQEYLLTAQKAYDSGKISAEVLNACCQNAKHHTVFDEGEEIHGCADFDILVLTSKDVIEKINTFLSHKSRNLSLIFQFGKFLDLKKRTQKGITYLEIHTPGYDGTLPTKDAVSFIEGYVMDIYLNGYLEYIAAQ